MRGQKLETVYTREEIVAMLVTRKAEKPTLTDHDKYPLDDPDRLRRMRNDYSRWNISVRTLRNALARLDNKPTTHAQEFYSVAPIGRAKTNAERGWTQHHLQKMTPEKFIRQFDVIYEQYTGG